MSFINGVAVCAFGQRYYYLLITSRFDIQEWENVTLNDKILRSTCTLVVVTLLLSLASPQHKTGKPAGSQPHTQPKSAAPAIPIPDIPYTKFVLKNGLTLLVHEDHKSPIVAINTWYHVGSKNEKLGKTGFAHLFEHLMFSGSQNFNYTYIKAMQGIGATALNGTTNNDRTNFFENVPVSMLDYALFAESDRMGHLLAVLDQKKLDLQRGVVQNEKRQDENEPYGLVWNNIFENIYPMGHPYSWPVIGSMQDLDAASMTDVQDWFRTYYGPNNATLVIAGDITPELARQKVEKYYGEIPPGSPIAKQELWVQKRTGSRRTILQDRVPQARLYRVWNVPQTGSPDETLLDLAAQVLGAGKTSRLYKRLVYKDQIATEVEVLDSNYEIGGQFMMILTAKPGEDLRKVEKAADEELQMFLKNGPTEQELQVAKTQIFGSRIRQVERIGGFEGKSDILAACQTFQGKPDCYKDYLKRVQQATTASVKKAADDWLSDGDYNLEVHPYELESKGGEKLDRSHPPAPGDSGSLRLPPMQKTTLSNGLKVVVAERHTAPVVNFTLLIDSGFSSDNASLPGVASFAQRMLDEGTPTRDSLKIAEELESLSARFGADADLDFAKVRLNALKLNMDQALEIYSDLILHPSFPEKEFKRVQKERLAEIQNEKVEPESMGDRVVPALLYGKGHPYGVPFTGTGTEESVSRMTREDLVRFHSTWYKPNNATLLVVGDTTLNEIKPRLEKLFSSWQAGEVPKRPVPRVDQPRQDEVYLVDRPGSGQSMIFAAQFAPPPNDPEAVPIQVMNGVFGGGFSARINMDIREDKHWSYGAGAFLAPARGQRPYFVSAPVQTDKTKDALAELIKLYRDIVGPVPITEAELKEAKDYLILRLPGTFETVQQLSGAYSNIIEYNLPENYYDTYTAKVASLNAAEANALAQRVILPDHLIWVVVGDMSKVEAGIRELNIGEVHKIDADGNPVK